MKFISLRMPFWFHSIDLVSQPWSHFSPFPFPYHTVQLRTNFIFSQELPNHLFYIPTTTIPVRAFSLHTHSWNCCLISSLTLSLRFQVYFICFHQADLPSLDFYYVTPCPLPSKIQTLFSRSLAHGLIHYCVSVVLTRGLVWENQCTQVFLGLKKLSWTLQDD